jgi:hypothetical protein
VTLNRYIVTADVTIPAGTSSAAASGPGNSASGTTSATPGAGTTVASQAAAAGTCQLSWTVSLATAAATGDAGNFGLYAGTALLATSVNAGTIGSYPQQAVTTYLEAGATVTVQAIAAGSTGAVYGAALTVTPVQSGGGAQGSVAWDGAGSPAGWTPGGFPVKFLQGTPLILDPSGDLYSALGAANLRAWIDGTDNTGHGHWGAISNLCSINQRLPGRSSTRRPAWSPAAMW